MYIHIHIYTCCDVREALGRGESVVIDATNALPDLRQQWVQLLRQAHKASNNNSNSNSQLRVRAVEFLAPERCDACVDSRLNSVGERA